MSTPKRYYKKLSDAEREARQKLRRSQLLRNKMLGFGVDPSKADDLLERFEEKDIANSMQYYDNQKKDFEDKAQYIEDCCERFIYKRLLKLKKEDSP